MLAQQIPSYIKSLNDNHTQLEKYVELLYLLQRNSGPLLETVTLIKHDKPLAHSLLKKRFQNNLGLSMLFSLSMGYEEAFANLQRSEQNREVNGA